MGRLTAAMTTNINFQAILVNVPSLFLLMKKKKIVTEQKGNADHNLQALQVDMFL